MCGISVCISESGTIDRSRFEAMTDIVDYRGPDDRGTFYCGDVALGHRRLSIIDLSSEGHQPFESVPGYVIVFNGEIYNYIELRDELIRDGYRFISHTDTEVIVHAYRKWGRDCLYHFNGMWSFVLYDKEKELLFGARDRFGIKPFYYTRQEGFFLVASEIKQFFKMLDGKPCADVDKLMRFVICGSMERPPYTMYKDIYQLEPGCYLTYSLRSKVYSIDRYYELDFAEDDSMPYSKACDTFRDTFFDSVSVRLRSDVPVGYFLSGGLDSSSIVCTADRIRRDRAEYYEQHTISSCYEDKRYDEQEYVDEVAKHTDVKVHKVYPEKGNLWETIDRIIWHMDEPLFGLSALSQRTVCKAAADHGLRVILDGQGSDEQLAGYNDFYIVLFSDLLRHLRFKRLRHEIKAYIDLRGDEYNTLSYGSLLLSAIKDCVTPHFLDAYFKKSYYKYMAKIPFEKKLIKRAVKGMDIYPRRNPREYIKACMTGELVDILHCLDRNTMAFSVEARDPFLDYRLVEKIYRMPYSYKIRNGWTKAVLRDGMSGVIPDKIKNRRSKLAFVAPLEKWVNDDRTMFRVELEKELDTLKPLFDKKTILAWYDERRCLSVSECNLLWRIIVSGRWLRIFDIRCNGR